MKIIKVLLAIMVGCLFLTGCGKDSSDNNNKYNVHGKYKITNMQITTCAENSDDIWNIYWPSSYYRNNTKIMLQNATEMTNKQKKAVYSFCSSLSDYREGEDYLCCVRMTVKYGINYNTVESCRPKYIYGDSYPEGYDEFMQIVNEICGGDMEYLYDSTTYLEITPELFTKRTDVDDAMVKDGTVEELIEVLGIDSVSKLNDLSVYDAETCAMNFDFVKYLVYDLRSEASTDEECCEFAKKLANELGVDESSVKKETAEYDDEEWYSIPDYKGYNLRVYRTELIKDDIVTGGGWIDLFYNNFKIYEDRTEPGSELEGYALYDFTYSKDDKYAIAVGENIGEEKDLFIEIGEVVEKIG